MSIFAAVMEVHEAAVIEAVDLELPQRTLALEPSDLVLYLLRLLPVKYLAREPLHHGEIGAEHAMDPQQLPPEVVARVLDSSHRTMLPWDGESVMERKTFWRDLSCHDCSHGRRTLSVLMGPEW